MRTPLLKPDAQGQTGTKLLAAITGKASSAIVDRNGITWYIGSPVSR